jgi:hypothetical protein
MADAAPLARGAAAGFRLSAILELSFRPAAFAGPRFARSKRNYRLDLVATQIGTRLTACSCISSDGSRKREAFAEVMINGKREPSLIEGGQVKALSIGFLADLEEDWRAHGKKVFPVLR